MPALKLHPDNWLMADVHSKEVRSYNMSRIRAKNTKPEMLVRKYLHAHGFRYRLHDKKLPGKPDIVLPKYKTVIFIHGCFWHGHEGCALYVVPKTKTNEWLTKIGRNKERDIRAIQNLAAAGWKIIVIWECELKRKKSDVILNSLTQQLQLSV